MKALFTVVCFVVGYLFVTHTSCAQRHQRGIGLRVGDPVGLTYKAYLPGRKAAEFAIGTTSRNWHGAYYRDTFKKIDHFSRFRYSSHDIDYSFALLGRLLFHESFPAHVEGRLDWFWGIGAQLRLSKLEYSYFDDNSLLIFEDRSNIDLGPEGLIGVEYELQDYPIVTYAEVSLMGEIIDQPFRFRFFGAVGIRYAF